MKSLLLLAAVLGIAAPALASDQPTPPATPESVVAQAPAGDWVRIAPDDLLVMQLSPAADGSARKIVIQLLPAPFSQPWVANIRTLAHAHWWDGTSIYRAVDNWVVQWGAGEGPGFKPRPLPKGVEAPKAPYVADASDPAIAAVLGPQRNAVVDILQAMLVKPRKQQAASAPAPYARDPYAPHPFFFHGWPMAASRQERTAWPVHCYGTVGVSRDLAPDTGTGAELYAVIGQAPRQLDRNIAVVGRVIEGMQYLSTLPRGKGNHGVYLSRSRDTPIVSIRLGSDLPAASQPHFEYLATDSASFRHYVQVRANRHDAFYTVPAGGVALCNVHEPIRAVPSGG